MMNDQNTDNNLLNITNNEAEKETKNACKNQAHSSIKVTPDSVSAQNDVQNVAQDDTQSIQQNVAQNITQSTTQNTAQNTAQNATPKRAASPAKKIALLAVFTALSLIMFLLENLFPSLLVPGAKMGLANIFSFATLILYGPLEAFLVIAVRTLLGAIFAGNVSALLFSFTGGIVSMAVSAILLYLVYPKISLLSISITAAVFHNITQIVVFVLLYHSSATLYYMPYLALIGILSGAIVGGVTMLLFKKVPLSVYEKALFK